ncbi:MAG: hypothetical protein KKE17_09185 [Proteobacteria bacterium]|nr:hypothetical protein [Pseudomonadota bacterium]MBU1710162.1 hypothetical protein [Pseudomonadota bacterium]
MKNKTTCSSLFLLIFLFNFTHASAEIDTASIFPDARLAASKLDLILLEKEINWQGKYLLDPPDKLRRQYPLITKMEVSIKLEYKENKIHATGLINDTVSFMRIREDDRKQLVKNVVDNLYESLVTGNRPEVDRNGRLQPISKKDIVFSIILKDFKIDRKGRNLTALLPPEYNGGIGQAGYRDGTFIFSTDYFAKIQIEQGAIVSGIANSFIFEKDSVK